MALHNLYQDMRNREGSMHVYIEIKMVLHNGGL
jgi:hypothetical protein